MDDAQARQVHDYVQALGREDRYIVMLYYADGLTPMEISRVLDLPSNAVRTRLEQLRSQLNSLTQTKAKPQTQTTATTTTATRAYA